MLAQTVFVSAYSGLNMNAVKYNVRTKASGFVKGEQIKCVFWDFVSQRVRKKILQKKVF